MGIIFFDQNLQSFIKKLEKKALAKTLRTLDLLEEFGRSLGMPHSKMIDRDLFELRIRSVQEVRIIYTFTGENTVLLFGFIKKSRRIPVHYVMLAKKKLASIERL